MTQLNTSGYPENNQSGLRETQSSSNQPLMAVTSQAQAKNNETIYFIVGGVGALVLLIVGFLVIAGLGVYFYTQRTNFVYANKNPKPSVTPTLPTTEPATKQTITNQTIKDYFMSRKKVGKFELVKTFGEGKDGYFGNTEAEVSGFYKNTANQSVIIVVAGFSSKEKARDEFKLMLNAEKKAGAKLYAEVRESEKSIAVSFQEGKYYTLMFCNFKEDASTPCYRIGSSNRIAVVDFYEGFFAK